MEHVKTYYSNVRDTPDGPIVIEGPLSSGALTKYYFHEHLTAFRPASNN